MVITFSGPQSSGKTTLLKILQDKNPEINFVPEVTRLVKSKYNVPINEGGTDITQALIMYEHIINLANSNGYDVSIFDRCVLDCLVYTTYLANTTNQIKLETLNNIGTLFDTLYRSYDVIFYTDPNDVEIEDDGERSTDKQFRDIIIKLFELTFTEFRELNARVVRLSGTVEERLNTIKQTLAKKGIEINI